MSWPRAVSWEEYFHHGRSILLVRTVFGVREWWCGYVDVPQDHPWRGRDDEHMPSIDGVPGGITYSKVGDPTGKDDRRKEAWYVGFAADHPDHVSLPKSEILDACRRIVEVMLSPAKEKRKQNVPIGSMTSTEAVDHPAHYKQGGIETIDAIEAWGLGFHLGNAVKYISRAGKKDPAKRLEDLKKARWYLDRAIEKDVS